MSEQNKKARLKNKFLGVLMASLFSLGSFIVWREYSLDKKIRNLERERTRVSDVIADTAYKKVYPYSISRKYDENTEYIIGPFGGLSYEGFLIPTYEKRGLFYQVKYSRVGAIPKPTLSEESEKILKEVTQHSRKQREEYELLYEKLIKQSPFIKELNGEIESLK